MQIIRAHTEVMFKLIEAAVHIHARIGRIIGNPHRNRRAPVAVPRDRPIPGTREPLPELAVFHVIRIPGDLLIELDHPVTELSDLHEPGRHRPVDERVAAPPAVRIGVIVGFMPDQYWRVDRSRSGSVLEVFDDQWVGIEN